MFQQKEKKDTVRFSHICIHQLYSIFKDKNNDKNQRISYLLHPLILSDQTILNKLKPEATISFEACHSTCLDKYNSSSTSFHTEKVANIYSSQKKKKKKLGVYKR